MNLKNKTLGRYNRVNTLPELLIGMDLLSERKGGDTNPYKVYDWVEGGSFEAFPTASNTYYRIQVPNCLTEFEIPVEELDGLEKEACAMDIGWSVECFKEGYVFDLPKGTEWDELMTEKEAIWSKVK